MRKVTCLCVVAFALLLTISGFVLTDSAVSDGADSQVNADSFNVSGFSSNSAGYGSLTYIADSIPAGFDNGEWVRGTNGSWHNINALSSDCGRRLTYSDVGLIDRYFVSDAVHALFAGSFETEWFSVLQVTYNVYAPCTVKIKVTNDAGFEYSEEVSENGVKPSDSSDYYFTFTKYESSVLIPLTSGNGGSFNVRIECGTTSISQKVKVDSKTVLLDGTLTDSDDVPLPNAQLVFTFDGTTQPAVYTDSAGCYSFKAPVGSIVSVKSLKLPGFTLDNSEYSYGSVYSAGSLAIKTVEKAQVVNVTDLDDRNVRDITVRIAWYAVSGGVVSEKILNPNKFQTDADGNVLVPLDPAMEDSGRVACIYLESNKYSVNRAGEPVVGSALPVSLSASGIKYYNDAEALKVDNRSVEVTLLSSNSALPLSGIPLAASWFTEDDSDGYRVVLDAAHRVWADVTDENGKTFVHYTSVDGSQLVISVSEKNIYTDFGKCIFDFDYSKITAVHAQSVSDRTSSLKSVGVYSFDSVPSAVTLYSDNAAYSVTCTITGDVPDMVTVDGVDYLKDAGSIVILRNSMAGSVVRLPLVCDGYRFDKVNWASPSLTEDVAVSITAALLEATTLVSSEELGEAVVIQTVSGCSDYCVEYSVDGNKIKARISPVSADMHFKAFGAAGSEVSDYAISSEECYLRQDSANQFSACGLIESKLVIFKSEAAGPSTMFDACPELNVKVYVYGELYFEGKSNENGVIFLALPDVPSSEIQYTCEGFDRQVSPVSGGIFDGFLGMNVYGVIGVDLSTYVDILIKYLKAGSSSHVFEDEQAHLRVGDTVHLVAPSVSGYKFAGWYLNGDRISDSGNLRECDVAVESTFDGASIYAKYSEKEEADPLTIAIGFVAVVIAIAAFAYVLVQFRKY